MTNYGLPNMFLYRNYFGLILWRIEFLIAKEQRCRKLKKYAKVQVPRLGWLGLHLAIKKSEMRGMEEEWRIRLFSWGEECRQPPADSGYIHPNKPDH